MNKKDSSRRCKRHLTKNSTTRNNRHAQNLNPRRENRPEAAKWLQTVVRKGKLQNGRCEKQFRPRANARIHPRIFLFFQAEDGIRGGHVTGVQTCALPILIISSKFESSMR